MVEHVSDGTSTSTPGQRFGQRLREEREHRGITLDTIAASTKIKASLFAGLERGDISDWPAGIFQRGFVREYARFIGLAPEPIVAEFMTVFAAGDAQEDLTPGGELRLTLAFEPREVPPLVNQLLVALGEVACLAALAGIASWITSVGFGLLCSALLVFYYPIATACLGWSPAAWYSKRDEKVGPDDRSAPDQLTPAAAEKRDRLYLVKPAAESDRARPGTENPDSADSDSPIRRSATRR
jgi:transcriptional regulator with XRE-family HTH domain